MKHNGQWLTKAEEYVISPGFQGYRSLLFSVQIYRDCEPY